MLDGGVNLIDTAPGYGTGHSEEFIEVKKAKAGYGPAPGALTEKGAVTPCRPLYTDGDVIYVLPCESISSQRN